MPIKRVQRAIDAIKKGEMIVMIDDEDRENEGDLVYAATFSTPQMVNFMAAEGRGLICVALEKNIADRLNLNPMVANNDSSYETAFTVSVDAKEAATGISAGERDMTIKILSNPYSLKDELVRPGHIFPLIAKDGGVLNRIGHTEGSVDLCKLSGVNGAAVICEIMREDGEMARRDDLDAFAKKHNLPILYIADIVEYRLKRESLIKEISKENIEFFGSNIVEKSFQDHLKRVHKVMIFGNISSCSNVKFHNVYSDVELLKNSEQYNGLIKSIEFLKKNNGILIFLDNRQIPDTNIKEVGIGAQILTNLGINKINLITTKNIGDISAISGFGLKIEKEMILI